jgi:hypothetical protein
VFCKTRNWTGGVAQGTKITNAVFDIPANIHTGSASVSVVTNGIASAAKTVTIN